MTVGRRQVGSGWSWGGCAVSRQLDSRLSCCRVFYNNLLPDPAATMYNLYPPAALGKGGSITQGSHHRPIRSGQEEEEEEEGKAADGDNGVSFCWSFAPTAKISSPKNKDGTCAVQ